MKHLVAALLLSLASCPSPSQTATGPGQPTRRDAAVDVAVGAECPERPECPAPIEPVVVPCDVPDPPSHVEALTTTGEDVLTLHRAKFADLPGWVDDEHAEAVPAFLRSCAKLAELADGDPIGSGPFGGKAGQWRSACAAAARVPAGDNAAARAFFEKEFTPYAAHGLEGPIGKMTGYYVQALNGSFQRGGKNQFPLLARPPDLVEVQLSDYIDDGRSRRIWGRVEADTGHLVPYPTRSELKPLELPADRILVWVDNPVDALAVEIEGSGLVTMEDGKQVWINFDGKNGRRFRGIGGIIRAMRKLTQSEGAQKGEGPAYETYLKQAHALHETKDSIVFFEVVKRQGAIGTQDVILTPRRSLAVDRAVIPLSTPIWVDTRAKSSADGPVGDWQHLLIAQDTGGHIHGTIRGDIYWGHDREAAAIGGLVNTAGRMWLLLPRAVRVPPPK